MNIIWDPVKSYLIQDPVGTNTGICQGCNAYVILDYHMVRKVQFSIKYAPYISKCIEMDLYYLLI